MQKSEEYIAYGIGNYYQAVKQEVSSIIEFNYICDKKFDNVSDTEYDGIQIIHRSQLKDKINATVVIFSCDEPLKQNLAKEFSENGMKYVFAMDLLGCTTVTGLEIKKNGVKGYWHYGTNEVFYHDTLPDNLQISFQGAHSSVYIGEP